MADKSLNRTEFVAAVAAESDQSHAIFAVLASSVAEGTKVSIPGWLAVERTHRSARTGRNPQTGEAIEIKASFGVKIAAGSKLKAAAKG
jgi:DNA-binding protein HU-beta